MIYSHPPVWYDGTNVMRSRAEFTTWVDHELTILSNDTLTWSWSPHVCLTSTCVSRVPSSWAPYFVTWEQNQLVTTIFRALVAMLVYLLMSVNWFWETFFLLWKPDSWLHQNCIPKEFTVKSWMYQLKCVSWLAINSRQTLLLQPRYWVHQTAAIFVTEIVCYVLSSTSANIWFRARQRSHHYLDVVLHQMYEKKHFIWH